MAEPEATPADRRASFEAMWNIFSRAYQPVEFRSNLKLWTAGLLAASLWFILGKIAWEQFSSSKEFASRLAALPVRVEKDKMSTEGEERVKLIEKANNMVDATANRLYTFLTPIVTAVTGYFFIAAGAPPPKVNTNLGSSKINPNNGNS